ncbi:uncharacterized protein LODBEIA_P05360 [Lodderomyces beijingensis]|uniref:Protein kinase domain-containing protein n=1 Tax=Lodderomyces beijingensis TaxID=1775926 RepID=A0ABP0ZDR8_9ASCO
MGLFGFHKRSSSKDSASEILSSQSSSKSIRSSSPKAKIKSILHKEKEKDKEKEREVEEDRESGIDARLENLNISPESAAATSKHDGERVHHVNQYGKRVSTMVERDDDDDDDDDYDYDYDYDDGDDDEDLTSQGESDSGSNSTSSSLAVDHLHPIKPKYDGTHHYLGEQLSTIMGYCGLKWDSGHAIEQAIKESKKTYSLLSKNTMIRKTSKSCHDSESVIGRYQIEFIQKMSLKLEELMSGRNWAALATEKSLYQRYGVVQAVIGKGSYGVIKLIEPDVRNPSSREDIKFSKKPLYAVKELKRRKDENNDKYIQRVLSEFVISSTLNNRHMVETVDLMGTEAVSELKISQVMRCSKGGDLFSYMLTGSSVDGHPVTKMSLFEVDCLAKQIAKGVRYMHAHGVSHCDLKLENILLNYEAENHHSCDGRMLVKLSDFGKSFVFKTELDPSEQMLTGRKGLIGSEPYIPPEEFACVETSRSYSSVKKDCWALGIVILVLLNLRRHCYTAAKRLSSNNTADSLSESDGYGSGFLWRSTELKSGSKRKKLVYKDKVFEEYAEKRLMADYNATTKDWLIKRRATFSPIDSICQLLPSRSSAFDDTVGSGKAGNNGGGGNGGGGGSGSWDNDDEAHELDELRVMVLYKLLDIDPTTRMSAEEFLKSDWMTATEACYG